MVWGTAQVVAVTVPATAVTLPWTSSVREATVMASTVLVLRTTSVKVTEPPGSDRVVGLAVFVSVIEDGVLVRLTVALPAALTAVPSSSTPAAVTVSDSLAPALPVKVAVNVHVELTPAAMVRGRLQVVAVMRPPIAETLPWTLSVRDEMVTASAALVLLVTIVYVKLPPGSGRVAGLGVLVTVMDEGTSLIVTEVVASRVAVVASSWSVRSAAAVTAWTVPASPLTVDANVQV